MSLVQATAAASAELSRLRFGSPVQCVYNPLEYAWDVHRQWLERFGRGRKEILLLGMNPGPFGMVQTGVPFGEIEAVRSWLRLHGVVGKPANEHQQRPVLGFACPRSEVSGRRLWSWIAQRCVTPQRFARRVFVHNYCPLAFVAESGANLTPDKLPRPESAPLFAVCDRLLLHTVQVLRPTWVIGVGAFAEARAAAVAGTVARIGRIPHPSPASPVANRGWERLADDALRSLGIDLAGGAAGGAPG